MSDLKRLNYFWARTLTKITGIVFIAQVIFELVLTRREGYEYTVHFCAGAFVLALLYSLALLIINALRAKSVYVKTHNAPLEDK